jgi:hypothetical protein
MGRFDLVRLQHVLEHFSYEEGRTVLGRCGELLEDGGLLLITVPDLRIHIGRYLKDAYKDWDGFSWWAHKRIPQGAPNSFYFSIFTHSLAQEPPRWCYDFEGLSYLIGQVGVFQEAIDLPHDDSMASFPFTHSRVDEDLCAVAQRLPR